jgi:hypothetical protein
VAIFPASVDYTDKEAGQIKLDNYSGV